MSRWFWILTAVMAAVYLVIVVWSLPFISAEAGGLTPFDLRPGGYSFDEAQAFLSALSAEGLAQYEGPQRWLDIVYPALLAAVLCWAATRITAGYSDWVRGGVIAVILIAVSYDYQENWFVAQMLAVGPDGITEALVEQASSATVTKSVLTSLVLFGLLGLFLRNWRVSRRG